MTTVENYHTPAMQMLWGECVLPYVERLRRTRSIITWLEIGSHHGGSAVWTSQNILTGDQDLLMCVDTWPDKVNKAEFDRAMSVVSPRKFQVYHMTSRQFCLGRFTPDLSLAGCYIDGDHDGATVLEDAVRVWPMVAVGGVIVFDDYLWQCPNAKWAVTKVAPQLGIDAFASAFQTRLTVLHRGPRQFIVQKRCE